MAHTSYVNNNYEKKKKKKIQHKDATINISTFGVSTIRITSSISPRYALEFGLFNKTPRFFWYQLLHSPKATSDQ